MGKQVSFFDEPEIDEKPYVEEENFTSRSKIKLVDLFAGIGGFHYGVAAAAAKVNKGVKPLLVSEIEKSCQETYRFNHKCEVQGDINKISLRGITDTADVVTAGFPCQPFSNSGLKLGLSDPRGQFYFKIEEIIKKYDAKSFVLENVSGIRFNGGGKYPSLLATEPQFIGKSMKFLEENLAKLKNYHIKWQEIDSSQLGSPQVRKRVYIVAKRDIKRGEELNYDYGLIIDDEKLTKSLKSQYECRCSAASCRKTMLAVTEKKAKRSKKT